MHTIKGVGPGSSDENGDLVFTENDLYATTNILSKLLRKIFIERHVTYSKLAEMHRDYMLKVGASTSMINYNWNNLKKAIAKDTLTFNMFLYVVTTIMNLRISNIGIQIEEEGKEELQTYELDV